MSTPAFYNRKLPHWQPPESTFFVTYRLAGSVPNEKISTLKEKYTHDKQKLDIWDLSIKEEFRWQYILAFDDLLDSLTNEPHWLKEDNVASIVMDSLMFNNEKSYELFTACIMCNHVHLLLRLLPGSPTLDRILQNHKKFTAVQSNKILKRSGKFWEEESFDTLVRNNAHFYNISNYIINNPVKAGLIKNWTEWRWTYIHPELIKDYQIPAK